VKRSKIKYAPFDVADHLNNEVVIAEYLTAALEEDDPDLFLAALSNVARARTAVDKSHRGDV